MQLSEVNNNVGYERKLNAQQSLQEVRLAKARIVHIMSDLALLNNLLTNFINDASNSNITFGEWLRVKNIKLQPELKSGIDALLPYRAHDEEIVDAILDGGDAYDDMEEAYDGVEEKEDGLLVFFGVERFSPAKGSKRAARKEARQERREARKEFRQEKRDLKKQKKSGQITKAQYQREVSKAKKDKKEIINEHGGPLLKRVWGGVKRFNPLSVTARGGALLALHANMFGWATRFAPAVVNDSKFKPQSIQKAKKGFEQFKKAWVKAGGEADKLEKAIREGYKNKPVFAKKKSGFDGGSMWDEIDLPQNFQDETGFFDQKQNREHLYSGVAGVDDLTVAGAISLGISLLTAIIPPILNRNKMDADPYAAGATPADYDTAEVIAEQPQVDLSQPVYDAEYDAYIDPQSGNYIDPKTGKTTGEWVDYVKWGLIGVGTIGLLILTVSLIRGGKNNG